MPRIPTVSTQTSPYTSFRLGTLRLPDSTPAQYGEPGWMGVTNLGQTLTGLDEKLRRQRDEIELVQLASTFETQVDDAKRTVLADPNTPYEDKAATFRTRVDAQFKELLNGTASSVVQRGLTTHATRLLTREQINVKAEALGRQAETQAVQAEQAAQQAMEKAATNPAEEGRQFAEADRLLTGLELTGQRTPEQVRALKGASTDRFYQMRAGLDPDAMLAIADNEQALPKNMDRAKLPQYVNLAMSAIAAQSYRQDRDEKRQEAQIKKVQDATDRNLMADVLDRKPNALDQVPAFLRSRSLDTDQVTRLRTVEKQLASEVPAKDYDRSLAPTWELQLRQDKHLGEARPGQAAELGRTITTAFLDGKIQEDEFRRLMGLYGDVVDAKFATNQEQKRQAKDLLVTKLATSGPADKYDALNEQTKEAALRHFWGLLDREDITPMQAYEDTVKLFHPVVKERQAIEEPERSALNDATMQALRRTGAISEAGYRAWVGRRQEEQGWQIVNETLKSLPPPPEPGLLERAKQAIGLGESKTEAKPSTVKPRKK